MDLIFENIYKNRLRGDALRTTPQGCCSPCCAALLMLGPRPRGALERKGANRNQRLHVHGRWFPVGASTDHPCRRARIWRIEAVGLGLGQNEYLTIHVPRTHDDRGLRVGPLSTERDAEADGVADVPETSLEVHDVGIRLEPLLVAELVEPVEELELREVDELRHAGLGLRLGRHLSCLARLLLHGLVDFTTGHREQRHHENERERSERLHRFFLPACGLAPPQAGDELLVGRREIGTIDSLRFREDETPQRLLLRTLGLLILQTETRDVGVLALHVAGRLLEHPTARFLELRSPEPVDRQFPAGGEEADGVKTGQDQQDNDENLESVLHLRTFLPRFLGRDSHTAGKELLLALPAPNHNDSTPE